LSGWNLLLILELALRQLVRMMTNLIQPPLLRQQQKQPYNISFSKETLKTVSKNHVIINLA
jgi:hypothetical protein